MPSNPTSDRTLLTGFGPFLEVTDNPSARVAAALGRPHQILEVSFAAVDTFLIQVDPSSFDRLIMLGVARGRTEITPELFARNQIGHTKDVNGNDRFGPIEEGAPLLLEGTLWTPEIVANTFGHRDLHVSMNAGNYLCNYAYYRALRTHGQKRVGFLHIPDATAIPLQEQIATIDFLVGLTET